jgi:membrane-bound serine protease (ClpP class)
MILSSYDALHGLPGNSAGVALVLLAFVLLVVDLKVTNHGLPTAAGLVALVLGVLMVFNTMAPFNTMATYLWALLIALVAVAILVGVLFVGALSKVRAAKERPVATGVEGMIGEVGVVKEPVGVSSPGWIFVHGEWWQAIAAIAPEDAYEQDHEQVIKVGRKVLVVGLQDAKVTVVLFEPTALEYSIKS